MIITLINKNQNYCTEMLAQSAKDNNIILESVDFQSLTDAKKHKWGDIIIWRNSSLDKKIDRTILFEFLKEQKKIVLNLGQGENPFIASKFYQYHKLANHIIKTDNKSIFIIPTYKFKSKDEFISKNTELIFPFIEKPEEGSQGNGVRIINNINDLGDTTDKIYQNFVKNTGDYRVICLGGVVLGCIKRTAAENDFRNNISQGGSAILIDDESLLRTLSNIALEINSVFNLNLCGVDIIFDEESNQYKFLEINTLVWWEGFQKITNINVSDKIIKHCIALVQRKTDTLVDIIYRYYNENYDKLGIQQFHFASRIFNWTKYPTQLKRLKCLENTYIGDYKSGTDSIISNILSSKNQNFNRNEYALRQKVLIDYPELDHYNQILFKFLFTKTIYKKNISKHILKHIALDDLIQYRDRLYEDKENFCILSTLALNYCYNLDFFLKTIKQESLRKLDPEFLLTLAGNTYQKESLIDKYNLQLYYYTHCIINESLFYSRKIKKNKKTYIKMLQIAENIIYKNYFDINLDNKLEFLVCCKLLGYTSKISETIFSESKNSISDIGNYLVDKYNTSNHIATKKNVARAEHRNVLFLMAFSEMQSS